MFNKTKGKVIATIMALAMAITALPVGGVVEAEAASKTKVMETNVNFIKGVQSGDDSSVYLNWLLSNEEVTFGNTYALNIKIYVPATFMESGSLWIRPNISFWTGEDLDTDAGWAMSSDGYSFDKESEAVTKYNDFYVVDAKMPIDKCFVGDNEGSFPEGQGQIIAGAFISGSNKTYKGSIYFDDVALVVDGTAVSTVDYENGNLGYCSYNINSSEQKSTPKVVSFSGKALEVSKTSLSVKKGKKVSIKATTLPTAKVTYKSSNTKVATVTSKGVVKGVKKGKATITVKANGKTVKVKVTVKQYLKTDLREPDVQYVHPVFSAGEREMKTLSKMERNEPDREYKISEPH